MTSALLNRQIAAAFGTSEEAPLKGTLDALQSAGLSDLAANLVNLLVEIEETYDRHAEIERRAEKARRLVACLDLTGDVLCEWDLVSRKIKQSSAWQRRFGIIGGAPVRSVDDWLEWILPDDRAMVGERLNTVLQRRAPLMEIEHRMLDQDDGWRWWLLRCRVSVRDGEGRPKRILVLHRDISEQKRSEAALVRAKEEAETANRARGAFLANMSHEIRTPMNAVVGMTELALDTPLDDVQRGYLETVKSSADALLTIIDDVLDLSKIEAGRLELESVVFSLRNVLGDIMRGLAVSAHRKGLEVLLDVAPDVPDRLYGDPTRLRQVLSNLVGNAIKFTERGEVAVEVSKLRHNGMSLYLQFVVRDTGIGIAPELHEQIFDAFMQGDPSTARRFGGTGLGLAITNRLVKLMDGQIRLESEPGGGSTFYFTSRVAADPNAAAPSFEQPAWLKGRTALVIDDCPHALAIIARMLQRLGLDVDTTDDADRVPMLVAERASAGRPYDILIADGGMPSPGGLALVQTFDNVLLLLANHAQRRELARSAAVPSRPHLVKPVFEDNLFDALRAAFDVADLRRLELARFEADEAAALGLDVAEPLNVLLVEDTPVNQALAVQLLTKAGHRVTVANNGVEALDWFEQQPFDLILMDLQMPLIDGMEATAKIRAREASRSWAVGEGPRQCYIAAMTAHAMQGDRERCLAAGMDDYISKPIRRQALSELLNRAIEHRSAPKGDLSVLLQSWTN
ncbi:PAS domain-containing hybrid sensor histidine kinase/response regulator [Aromatoleum petrolei]|uniref:histidine kinase n=1 Tax=Aromatoleum petrolei TaxID=76116 RepID=A0ABX1MVI2_9RHOO|nr:PAS domain-containing hybrid sensor histidine kinase/response regulator [Aromatoleum petrolei]NMF90345.1 response regulator [Aromatoleum petrolei]QTQ37960.1 Two component system fusion protein (sensory histidine kinase and response regulator) [Aromatoleum petrolei]